MDEINWNDSYDYPNRVSLGDIHPGWDNPNNPHYPGETNVPFDDGVWLLVVFVVAMHLIRIVRKTPLYEK